jgi:hypothetical protein
MSKVSGIAEHSHGGLGVITWENIVEGISPIEIDLIYPSGAVLFFFN